MVKGENFFCGFVDCVDLLLFLHSTCLYVYVM